jgi:hypothetical protein
LTLRADATDPRKVAEEGAIRFARVDTRKTGKSRLRPAPGRAVALSTAASFNTAADSGGAVGTSCRKWRRDRRSGKVEDEPTCRRGLTLQPGPRVLSAFAPDPRPNKVAMSHVEKGAVHGARINVTSQDATTCESIDVCH